MRSQRSSIMDPIGPDTWSYMPLNKKKENDIFQFVYTLDL